MTTIRLAARTRRTTVARSGTGSSASGSGASAKARAPAREGPASVSSRSAAALMGTRAVGIMTAVGAEVVAAGEGRGIIVRAPVDKWMYSRTGGLGVAHVQLRCWMGERLAGRGQVVEQKAKVATACPKGNGCDGGCQMRMKWNGMSSRWLGVHPHTRHCCCLQERVCTPTAPTLLPPFSPHFTAIWHPQAKARGRQKEERHVILRRRIK